MNDWRIERLTYIFYIVKRDENWSIPVHGWFLFLLGFYIVDIFWLYYVFTPYTKHFIKIKVLQLRECKGVMLHSYLHITDTCLWRSLSSVYKMVIVERFDFNETQQKPLQNESQISS